VKAFDTDPHLRWLFCMTHPDDEISICCWIKRLTQLGVEVHLSWTHSNPTREAEARAAAHVMGVPTSNLHFLHGADGRIPEEMPSLLPRFRALFENVKPDRVCCGAFEQGHLDHDATNFLVGEVFDGPIFEIPFYHTYLTRFQRLNRFADPTGQELIELSIQEQKFKTLVARQFPSQNIWSVLLWYEVWQKARFRPMELSHSERMRLQPAINYRRPNLPPRLATRVKRSANWRRWKAALRAFQAQSPKSNRERQLVAGS
jgi:LmbE family N-acetylglucosaminyl deacetylase